MNINFVPKSPDQPCHKGLSDNVCDAPWCDCCNIDYAHVREFIVARADGQDETDVALSALDRLVGRERS